jgi:hypothetical protein
LKPGVREERILKEITSNGKFQKNNHLITARQNQISPSGQRENGENVGNNRIKDDSDQGKPTVTEGQ